MNSRFEAETAIQRVLDDNPSKDELLWRLVNAATALMRRACREERDDVVAFANEVAKMHRAENETDDAETLEHFADSIEAARHFGYASRTVQPSKPVEPPT